MPSDLRYLLLLFLLLIVPRALQRFRLPAALSCVAFGIAAAALGEFDHDHTVALLATLGIVSLFLFAGLEVKASEMRRGAMLIGQHLAVRVVTLAAATAVVWKLLGLGVRPSLLLALALFTPSTGFILDSLEGFGLDEEERFWTKAKAIASELLALIVMFFALQSTSGTKLGLSVLALLGLAIGLPVVLRVFARVIVPYAAKSEFAFLVMVAVVSAYATQKLGVYYLVGAFAVGVAAQSFRERLPALSSEKMIGAIEAFASVFVPFYFFKAGSGVTLEDLGTHALLAGGAFVIICVPIKMGLVMAHRRLALGEKMRQSYRVALALTPTLVFSLIIADILRERFALPEHLFGGLVIYTLVNTLLPGFILRAPVKTIAG